MNTRPDNRQRIDAAFALLRNQEPERFDLPCMCAVHDKPYTLRFVRKANGLFRLEDSEKATSGTQFTRQAGAHLVTPATIPIKEIELTAFPCPWCDDISFHHCSQNCGAFVCGGRIKGNVFHCRPSCGASWVGAPLEQVKGQKRQELRRPSMPQASHAPMTAPAVSKPKLMLGVGQSIAVRDK
jgi:hypothetical protein